MKTNLTLFAQIIQSLCRNSFKTLVKNYDTDTHNKGSGRRWKTGTLSIRLSNFKNKPKFYSKENKLAAKEKETVERKLKRR